MLNLSIVFGILLIPLILSIVEIENKKFKIEEDVQLDLNLDNQTLYANQILYVENIDKYSDFKDYRKEDFTNDELEILDKYCRPFINRLKQNDNSLKNMYFIPQPGEISNKKFPYHIFKNLQDKNLAKNNELLCHSYIYYEKYVNFEVDYSRFLCQVLKIIRDNEDNLRYNSLYKSRYTEELNQRLNERELIFIIFLLNSFKYIELQKFEHYTGIQDYKWMTNEELLKFNRITTLGHKFLRLICPQSDLINLFKTKYHQVNKIFEEKYSNLLFKPLKKEDIILFKNLRVPLTIEEFDSQINNLAKSVNDSLNSEFLKTKINLSRLNNNKLIGSITYLKEFLQEFLNIDAIIITTITNSFNQLQAIRSSGTAHRRGREYDKKLRKYDLIGLSNKEIFYRIIKNIIQSMERLEKILEQD